MGTNKIDSNGLVLVSEVDTSLNIMNRQRPAIDFGIRNDVATGFSTIEMNGKDVRRGMDGYYRERCHEKHVKEEYRNDKIMEVALIDAWATSEKLSY